MNKGLKFKYILNFLITIFSTYIGLFLSDLFISNLIKKDYNSKINYTTKNYLKKLRKNAINETIKLKKEGYLPVVNPNVLLKNHKNSRMKSWFPLAGKSNSKTYLSCDEGYGVVKYNSDRFGFRNNDENWDKIFKEYSTLFIGDSFIHGYCVHSNNTIPKTYEKLSGKLTFNLGMGNNNPYNYIATIKYLIEPLIKNGAMINEVYLIFYTNDNVNINPFTENKLLEAPSLIKDSNDEKNLKIETSNIYNQKMLSAIENVIEIENPSPLPSFLEPFRVNFINFKANLKLSNLKNYITLISERKKESVIQKDYSYSSPTFKALKYLKEICTGNCVPKVGVIPNSKNWNPDSEAEIYIKYLENISKKIEIDFVDISLALDSNYLKDYAPGGGHLSNEGYQKTSSFLYNIKN
tara:strand:- start:1881 stop:3104 length:1224 start_codon:yes stop_codon:yes gene_type:complete